MTTEMTQVNNNELLEISFASVKGFELMQRQASMFAQSMLVPKDYKDNIGNCCIAINMANRMNMEPLMVMQNLIVIYGRPSWSAKFIIARVNTCGRFTPLQYEFFGKEGTDDWGCRAWAIDLRTNAKLVGTLITIKLAKSEGWYEKNGSKWKTIPEQMLMYRAASWWANVHAPEVTFGIPSDDEVREIIDVDSKGNITNVSNSVLPEALKNIDDFTKIGQLLQQQVPTTIQTAEKKESVTVDMETGKMFELEHPRRPEELNIINDIMKLIEIKNLSAKYKTDIDNEFKGYDINKLKRILAELKVS